MGGRDIFLSSPQDIDQRYSEVFGNFRFDADTDRTIGRDWTEIYYKYNICPIGQS
ncbi:MAG: hypothetical protein ACOX4L_03800 [Bacillota bacterium]|jgi:hypothetical protein